jgi:signal transduction histidine kinase
LVLDEVTRIAAEAIFNVRRHAHATRLDIEIDHSADLTIRIADNGKGIDPQFAEEGGRDGHFGLVGMHERASSLRGNLTVQRKVGGGTVVILSVPGPVAYKSGRGMFRRLWASP